MESRSPPEKLHPSRLHAMHCFVCATPLLTKKRNHAKDRYHQRAVVISARARSTTTSGRGRAAKRSALYASLAAYAAHFEPLIVAERAAEQEAALEVRSSGLSRTQLEQAGVALFALHVSTPKRSRLYSNAVFSLRRTGNGPLPEYTRFSPGDLVAIAHNDDEDDIEATVLRRGPRVLDITVPTASASCKILSQLQEDRVQVNVFRGASAVVYERALDSLRTLTEPSSSVTPLMRLIADSHVSRIVDTNRRTKGSPFFDLVPGIMQIETAKQLTTSEERARERVRSRYEWKSNPALNPAQGQAVRAALSRTATLIHGPPGTGKTRTAAQVAAAALAERRGPVLATAASNTAADALLAAICSVAPDARILRVGRVAAVSPKLWRYTLDAVVERDPELQRARSRRASTSELFGLEQAAALRAVRKAQVVVCTCVSAGRDIIRDRHFPFLLIDEATQATETDVLIPLACGYAAGGPKQLVLAGDHHQLPPTILANDANELEISMFARLWSAGVQSFLLNTQYRMHPSISSFPCTRFYDGKLRDAVGDDERPLPDAVREGVLDIGSRVVFVDIEGEEVRGTKRDADGPSTGYSYGNKKEVEVVAKIVSKLSCEGAFRPESVGVITPYSAQTRLIMRKTTPWPDVEVSTVDGFQGREKEAIIISTVRCNAQGDVGFVADWRRLNVAISRARSLLVVVGSHNTLRTDGNWEAWLKWVCRNKAFLPVNELC